MEPSRVVVFRPHPGAVLLASGFVQVVLAVALLAAPCVASAWLPWPSGTTLLREGGLLLYVLAALGSLVAVERWARGRASEAELHGDRLVVRVRREGQTYLLAELEAFDDARGDVVRVRTRPGRIGAHDVWVPTSTDDDRAALLDALSRAGVPRVEGALPESTTCDGAEHEGAPPRLVVVGDTSGLDLLGSLTLVACGACLLLGIYAPLPELLKVVSRALAVALVVGASLCLGLAGPRRGRAWFHDDRIVHDAGASSPRRVVLVWDEVEGWRGESAHSIVLVLRDGLLRDTHGDPRVPTPTPELRAAVEALLAEKGVPRLDGLAA